MRPLAVRYGALVFAILVLNFTLPRALPGDPFDDDGAGGLGGAISTLTPGDRAALRDSYRLDAPLYAQWSGYVGDLVRGNLGWSISRRQPVAELIGERLPWTLGLVTGALLLAVTSGVLLGLLSAWKGHHSVLVSATLVAGVPEFLLGMLMLLVFSVVLGWLPLHGLRSPFGAANLTPSALDVAVHMVLPALALTVVTAAPVVLLVYGAVASELGEAYVATGRAKGLGGATLAVRHVLPNALAPLVTAFGLRAGQVFGGAIVIERVFGLPGLGMLSFEAMRARDYPVLQAVFLLASSGVLLATLAIEIGLQLLERRRASAG